MIGHTHTPFSYHALSLYFFHPSLPLSHPSPLLFSLLYFPFSALPLPYSLLTSFLFCLCCYMRTTSLHITLLPHLRNLSQHHPLQRRIDAPPLCSQRSYRDSRLQGSRQTLLLSILRELLGWTNQDRYLRRVD